MFLNCTSQNTEKPSVSINELPGIHPSYFSYDIWLHSLDHILIWQWFCNMIFIERIKRSFSLCSRWLSKICFLLLIAGMCWTLNRPIFMTMGLYPQRVRTVIRSNSHIPVQRIFLCSGAFLLLSLFLAGIKFTTTAPPVSPQSSVPFTLHLLRTSSPVEHTESLLSLLGSESSRLDAEGPMPWAADVFQEAVSTGAWLVSAWLTNST